MSAAPAPAAPAPAAPLADSIIIQFQSAMAQAIDPRFMRNRWYSTGQSREIAEARILFHKLVEENWAGISRILSADLSSLSFSASWFCDFYKLSMAPTIHALQKLRGDRAVVRFALDIRNKNLRDMFAANTDGITEALIKGLNALQNRTFDYQVILDAVRERPCAAFFDSPEGRALFFNPDGSPRTLISTTPPHGLPFYPKTVICSVPIMNLTMLAPGKVVVSVFEENDAKTGERRIHVEAAGDASLASFLETTMMQVVYQTALKHHLANRGCSFGQWLYEALFRFYLSATFAGTQCPGMTGFLFAGRRTGHFLLLLLQAFLAKKIPGAKIAGTSSFDAVHFLTNKLGFTDIIGSVGTHAHEIQMLAQSLYAWLDKHPLNPEGLEMSACLTTYMYYRTAHQGKSGPDGKPLQMPMLPDTLGTRAFCKAAACFMVYQMKDGVLDTSTWVPLLSLIKSARQDSGDLGEFARTVRQYGFEGGLMASEVDDAKKLMEASKAGYDAYGSGGFMGDSENVWNVTGEPAFSASMAVKPVDVWLVTTSPCETAKVFEKCPSPCKLGDGTDPTKVTTDALLQKTIYDKVIANAQLVKSSAEAKHFSDHQFFCEVDLARSRMTVIRDLYSKYPDALI